MGFNGLDSNALHTNGLHRNGIDTIGMDTYRLTAHGVAAARSGVTGTILPFPVADPWENRSRCRKDSLGEDYKSAGCARPFCGDVGLRPLPAEPLTVARYLAARAGSGASIATMRLATSAITKAHEWAGHESPCRDRACAPL